MIKNTARSPRQPRARPAQRHERVGAYRRRTTASSIGVQAIVTNHHLALVGDMRGHPGDELQIIHHLLLRAVPAPAIADLGPLLQKETGRAERAIVILKSSPGQLWCGFESLQARHLFPLIYQRFSSIFTFTEPTSFYAFLTAKCQKSVKSISWFLGRLRTA